MVPSHERGFQKRSQALALSACSSQSVHLNAKSGFRDSGLVLLRQMELALLLKTRASVVVTQGLELGPLLRRRCDGMGLGLVGCWSWELHDAGGGPDLVEAVELRKNEFAVAVVLGAWVLRLRVCACIAAALPLF